MTVRRFQARSARETLRLIRQALGADALILSNRVTPDGVEIMAVAPADLEVMTAAASNQQASAVSSILERSGAQPAPHGSASPPIDAEVASPAAWKPGMLEPIRANAAIPTPEGQKIAGAAGDGFSPSAHAEVSYDLLHEVRLLRALMEGELAAFAWNDLKRRDASKVEVLRRFVAAGFSPALARSLTDELPDGLDLLGAWRAAKAALQARLPVAPENTSLVDEGGVFALVGPTGVGKTTTVAKLAAECALKFGPEQLALVTTDTYRIGAVDQLRIYGDILGVPVYAIRNDEELRRTLGELRTRHLVLVDTVGMGQRDRRIVEQIALLMAGGQRVRSVLLLSAVAQASVLDDVVRGYAGDGLSGCILTKVDEAVCLGGALDVLIHRGLALQYLTNGQRVPEDLHRPNPLYLVERAFRAVGEIQPIADSEMPVILAAATGL